MSFLALFLVLSLPASAQMRGGSAGRGFAGGRTGGFSGGFRGGVHQGFGGGIGGFRGGVIMNRGFRPQRFHGDRDHRFFAPVAPIYPYAVYPYALSYPFWWDDSEDMVEQPAPQPQPIVIVVDRAQQQPAPAPQPAQIIEREGDRYVQRGSGSPLSPAPAVPKKIEPPPPPAVLILRDGRKLEVTDYAITGDTFYDLSGGRTHRIAVADINLPATQKANEARGINLSLPSLSP